MNVGTSEDVSIAELAETIGRVTGFLGQIEFDRTRPDGTPRKLMDVNYLRSKGWKHRTTLEQGITETFQWYGASPSKAGQIVT